MLPFSTHWRSLIAACSLADPGGGGIGAVCELCTHGSNVRTIPGHRRMCLLRYSPKETAASAHAPLGWEAPPVRRENPLFSLTPCVLRYVPRGCLKCAWVRRQEVFARLGPEARAMIAPTPAAPEEEGGTLSAKL